MPQTYAYVLSQDALRRLWHDGQQGRLSAWEVAKALGLRQASKELSEGILYLPWVAQRLEKWRRLPFNGWTLAALCKDARFGGSLG